MRARDLQTSEIQATTLDQAVSRKLNSLTPDPQSTATDPVHAESNAARHSFRILNGVIHSLLVRTDKRLQIVDSLLEKNSSLHTPSRLRKARCSQSRKGSHYHKAKTGLDHDSSPFNSGSGKILMPNPSHHDPFSVLPSHLSRSDPFLQMRQMLPRPTEGC